LRLGPNAYGCVGRCCWLVDLRLVPRSKGELIERLIPAQGICVGGMCSPCGHGSIWGEPTSVGSVARVVTEAQLGLDQRPRVEVGAGRLRGFPVLDRHGLPGERLVVPQQDAQRVEARGSGWQPCE
jgi:hypothetical protein